MNVLFSPHALLKIKQRTIPENLVINTVENPDLIYQGYDQRLIYEKKFDTLNLRVVLKTKKNKIVIITSHWVKSKP